MIQLRLYTTEGCHLCESAEQILHKLSLNVELNIEKIEIGDDAALVEQYGHRIPVIAFSDSTELKWPFEVEDIVQKINNL